MTSLWILCDTSGSMCEGGKHLIVRGVVRQVEQYFRFGYGGIVDVRICLWSENVKACEWDTNDEIPPEILQCRGSANLAALVEFIETQDPAWFLLLTDGFWSWSRRGNIQSIRENLTPDKLRIIKIGMDSNPSLHGIDVFATEETLSLLDKWPPR